LYPRAVISEAVDRVIVMEATCVSGCSFEKQGEKRFQF
jgi:hypothetical protein